MICAGSPLKTVKCYGVTSRRVAAAANKSRPGSSSSAQLSIILTMAALSTPPAYADVDDAVSSAVDSVKAAGEALKAGKTAADGAVSTLGELYQKISPSINETIDKATPYIKRGVDEATRVATPLAKDIQTKGVPIVTEGTKNILRSSGVDVDSLSAQADTASKSIQDVSVKATPFVTKVTNFLTTSSPETLGKIAVVLVLAYYLTPFALKATVSSLRGYAGEITPARAVDIVATDSNVAIIDIRAQKEKASVGTPDVPSSARGRFIELEIAEVDRRLRGQLRNVDAVEAQVTALEIQALKRVNKGTKILLMDKNGSGTAKAVAKELAGLGFGNAFIIAGGFQGWTSSKLQVKPPGGSRMNGTGLPGILGTIRTSTRKI
eukprot:jgi/Ulvmu1/5165/UM021_0182.1